MCQRTILLAALAAMLALSSRADADRRENSLRKDVAVRHRRLLVKNRFELAPLFESSINSDFQQFVGGGAKLEYHLSDKWSIGAVGVGSVAFHTATTNRIYNTLSPNARVCPGLGLACSGAGTASPANQLEPTQTEFLDHLNSMPLHGAAYISLTPWYGKLAAFSTAFVAFDFYFQAGVAFAQLTAGDQGQGCPSTVCSDPNPGGSYMGSDGQMHMAVLNPNLDAPLNDGFRVGLYLGGGVHVFLNDFLALDLTVRDYLFSDNPSGADYDADRYVSPAESRFLGHLFFGAGLSILFPTTVKRTP